MLQSYFRQPYLQISTGNKIKKKKSSQKQTKTKILSSTIIFPCIKKKRVLLIHDYTQEKQFRNTHTFIRAKASYEIEVVILILFKGEGRQG